MDLTSQISEHILFFVPGPLTGGVLAGGTFRSQSQAASEGGPGARRQAPPDRRAAPPAGERLQEFTARNISNTVYALAIMQINPGHALLSALAAQAVKKIGGFIAQNLSNTVW